VTIGDRLQPSVPRRAVLLGGAGILAAASGAVLAGCTGSFSSRSAGTRTATSSDELAAGRAVLAARSLLVLEANLARRSGLAALVTELATVHRAHLEALGMPDDAPSPSGPTTRPQSGSPSGTTGAGTSSPTAEAVAPATAVGQEQAAATEALADVTLATPGTAGLLARIAASRAANADLLAAAADLPLPGTIVTPGLPPSPSILTMNSDDALAVSALLAGEHAAVFAYGLITARAQPAQEALAQRLWAAHRARRDDLTRRLVAAGQTPVAAEPAYDVGRPPAAPAQLTALAARVEDSLAAVALRAVTGTVGTVRLEAAADLVLAARRTVAWRGTAVALPGSSQP
jgi:hypothetical protein